MGQPTRPTRAITYEQAVEYDSNPIKWFVFHGHITNTFELSTIFNVNHTTVLKRLKSGWQLESALIASANDWTIRNVHYLQNDPQTALTVKTTLDQYFAPKETKTKNGKRGS